MFNFFLKLISSEIAIENPGKKKKGEETVTYYFTFDISQDLHGVQMNHPYTPGCHYHLHFYVVFEVTINHVNI